MSVTWHDILKFNGIGGDEVVQDVKVSCPEFTGYDLYGNSFDIGKGQTTVEKDVFTSISRIESTPVDIFKAMNEGVGVSKGNYELRDFRIAPAGSYFRLDKDFVKIDPARGAAYMKNEAVRIVQDAIRKLGVQFFYGHGANATAAGAEEKGFQGIEPLVDASLTSSAGGTVSGGSSSLTSAYLVKFSQFDGVTWLFGQGGSFDVSDIYEVHDYQTVGGVSKAITWLQQDIKFFPGVAVQSKYAVGRIANIDTSTFGTVGSMSSSALTDEHFMLALNKMKERPDVVFMTPEAGVLLGASRMLTLTVRGSTLKGNQISMPTDVYGVPICYTDSIINSEAQVS